MHCLAHVEQPGPDYNPAGIPNCAACPPVRTNTWTPRWVAHPTAADSKPTVTMLLGILFTAASLPAMANQPALPTAGQQHWYRSSPGLVLYVSPAGNDRWSGRRAEADPNRNDGALATLRRARDEIRRLKREGSLPQGGIRVEVLGGTYQPANPLELEAIDSGTPDRPIVYCARKGELVRITGGVLVRELRPVTDRAILRRLDPAARAHVRWADLKALGVSDFGSPAGGGIEVFCNDRPMTLARWPNEGFTRIVDVTEQQPFNVRGHQGSRMGAFYYEGDRPTRWTTEPDLWVHGYWFWDWSDQRHPVASIDVAKRLITVKPPYHRYGYRKGKYYYAYNALVELDQPGEWYVDRQRGILYFWPPKGSENARVVVSVLPELIRIREASYVCFQGMIFEAARGTALSVTGGSHVAVVGCVVRNTGDWAIRVSGGSDHLVAGCEIYSTGGGGVGISGGDRKLLRPARHCVYNNHIHHYARWNRMYRPAVAISGVGIRVTHNLIHDAPHQAIAFSGNDHLIEGNEIHHVCEESNDAGAIYAGRDWTMRGTVIRHNYLHHIRGFEQKGCMGVYLDDMFCGTTIVGNVFYDVTRAAFIGGGRDNRVENNIFVDCKPALHIDARALGWASYHVDTTMKQRLEAMPYRQRPWKEKYPELLSLLSDQPAAPKGNVVRCNVCVAGRWDEVYRGARQFVQIEDNLITDEDPGFVDRENLDFRLRDDAPLLKKLLCFRPIPFETIGLVVDHTRAVLPPESEERSPQYRRN